MECPIVNTALSLLMKHLVIGQRPKTPNFSTFHWSPHASLVSIDQHFETTRVVHLPKRTETSLITVADLIAESDQAVRAMHSCNSRFTCCLATQVGFVFCTSNSGPGCSKLTTSLVNVWLNFQTLISEKCQNFLVKKCEKLLQCKSFSHFFNTKF